MTDQQKKDARTILGVAFYLVAILFLSLDNGLTYLFLAAWFISAVYRLYENIQYNHGNRPDTIRFPTLNDNYLNMSYISAGILLIIFSLIGHFALSLKTLYAIFGVVTGIVLLFPGFVKKPIGSLRLEKNHLFIYSFNNKEEDSESEEKIDIRQIKEIVLKNDSISFINIYGEPNKITLLNLDTSSAEQLKDFFARNLPKEVTYINKVQ